MPQRDPTGIGERVPHELLGADFDIAFSFVEMAQEESRDNNAHMASQLLANAERTLNEIQERLLKLTPQQREAYEPRCAKLSQAIQLAKTPDSAQA